MQQMQKKGTDEQTWRGLKLPRLKISTQFKNFKLVLKF